jgi:hypothetical protein
MTEYEVTVKTPVRLRTVLAVAALLSVLCCGGLGAGAFVVLRKVDGSTAPIRNAGTAFLDDLEAGDYAAAYGRLCRSTQERFSQEAFVAAVSGQSAIRAYHVDRVRLTNTAGRLGGTVSATLVTAAGAPQAHTLTLTSESGAWKVCGNPY